MSEKITSVRVGSELTLSLRGHVSYSEAVEQVERFYEQQIDKANYILEGIRNGQCVVHHQTGITRVRDRAEVTRNE